MSAKLTQHIKTTTAKISYITIFYTHPKQQQQPNTTIVEILRKAYITASLHQQYFAKIAT
jgi:hypothetical protein